jgi:hypothetical protein
VEIGIDELFLQFCEDGIIENNTINADKFLDSDITIDLEKLELAIIMLINNLEKSGKVESPIYINIGNMEEYVAIRGLTDLDKIIEESAFIIGFCQAIATENEIDKEVIVRFAGNHGT